MHQSADGFLHCKQADRAPSEGCHTARAFLSSLLTPTAAVKYWQGSTKMRALIYFDLFMSQ